MGRRRQFGVHANPVVGHWEPVHDLCWHMTADASIILIHRTEMDSRNPSAPTGFWQRTRAAKDHTRVQTDLLARHAASGRTFRPAIPQAVSVSDGSDSNDLDVRNWV